MNPRRALALSLLATAVAAPVATAALPAQAAAPKTYSNCKALNQVYPHGVGKPGARDKTSARSKPVTTFTKSAAVYQANAGSDRDHDGIACEKR